jgi:hypothetical protein
MRFATDVIAARENATIRQIQTQRDETRKTFDSLKQSASGIFDALFSRTQSFGEALKNTLKTAILTPMKEILTSQTAAIFTKFITGESVTFAGNNPGGRFGGLRPTLGRMGLGAPQIGRRGIDNVQLVNGRSVPVWIMNTGQQAQETAQRTVEQASSGGIVGKLAAGAGGIGAFLGLGGLFGGKGSAPGGYATGSKLSFPDSDLIYTGASTGTFGTPPFLPGTTAAGSYGVGGGARAAGFAGMFGNPLGMLRQLGGLGRGATDVLGNKLGSIPGTAGAKLPGVGGAAGGAMLLGGGILAADGLRRGGMLGLAETTAGGALIGAKFGGPVGALIGAAIGFTAGTIRLFVKGAEERAKERIRSIYGLTVSDRGILKQIVQMAKESYGGNIDTAIRSPQIRELLELYAMSTGQSFGTQAKVRAASFTQTSGGMLQNTLYENGRSLAFAASARRRARTSSQRTAAVPVTRRTTSRRRPRT